MRKRSSLLSRLASSALVALFLAGCSTSAPSSPAPIPANEQACEAGPWAQCYTVALKLERTDPVTARRYYERACDGGHAYSCTNLGALLGKALGGPKDSVKAAALYRKACNLNDAMACTNLADFTLRGEGVPRDVKAGIALYTKACDGGRMNACRDLGTFFALGDNGVAAEPERGAILLRKACDGKFAQACADLGALTCDGLGVPRDIPACQRLFERACEGGYTRGCNFEYTSTQRSARDGGSQNRALRPRPGLDNAPRVPCPYAPLPRAERITLLKPQAPNMGPALDFALAFERDGVVSGRAVECRALGELVVNAGPLWRQEGLHGGCEKAGLAAPGRYPVYSSTNGDPATPWVLVAISRSRPVMWEHLPRTAELGERTGYTAFVDESQRRELDPRRWLELAEIARRGIALSDDGRWLVHPSFGALRGLDANGQLAALAVIDLGVIEAFMPERVAPLPQKMNGGPCAGVPSRVPPIACPPALRSAERCASPGALLVTSGRIVAADPLVNVGMPPFADDFPLGRHPVTIAFHSGEVARALVQVSGSRIARWEPARLDREPKSGEVRTYPVDSGLGAFLDVDAADRILVREFRELTTASANGLAKLVTAGLRNGDAANVCGDPLTGANLIAFSSGAGDGSYPTYVGRDAKGKPVALLTDFGIDEQGPPKAP